MNLLPLRYSYTDDYNKTSNKWKKFRASILKKNNNKCHTCDMIYTKYMLCIKFPDNEYYPICKLCNYITSCHTPNIITLAYSKLSQKEIVIKTATYINNNDKVPHILELDKNAKSVPITLYELSDIIRNIPYNKIQNNLKNYKLFFNKKLNINDLGISTNSPMFIDENEENTKISNNIDQYNLPERKLTQNEKKFLNDSLVTSNHKLNTTKILQEIIKSNKIQKKLREMHQTQYKCIIINYNSGKKISS